MLTWKTRKYIKMNQAKPVPSSLLYKINQQKSIGSSGMKAALTTRSTCSLLRSKYYVCLNSISF